MLSSSLSVREASPCVKQNIMLYISGGRIRLADWRRTDATAGENGARERLGRNLRGELERRPKSFIPNACNPLKRLDSKK